MNPLIKSVLLVLAVAGNTILISIIMNSSSDNPASTLQLFYLGKMILIQTAITGVAFYAFPPKGR